MSSNAYVLPFEALGIKDVDKVGGKNASLGEMIGHLAGAGVRVPSGFATTAEAFRAFLAQEGLSERIYVALSRLDVEDVRQLKHTGKQIREWIKALSFQALFVEAVRDAYETLGAGDRMLPVAVRSSATAEDLPEASFAGQQETFLNVRGLPAVLQALKAVFASLFHDRAIAYRAHHGFSHEQVALSAGIQKMVRSDLASSGVMFTIDTESGFSDVVFITSSFGLGELVVQGAVNPDEFYIYKPTLRAKRPALLRKHLGGKQIKLLYQEGETDALASTVKQVPVPPEDRGRFSLTDEEAYLLAEQALKIEAHYGCAMDIEWAKDGSDQQLYIVQARPETVKSRSASRCIEKYFLQKKGPCLLEGRSIGQRIGSGTARIVKDISQMDKVQPGDVLVADMTDPDWEPIMKRAAAIVTNRGGRTCHAAIIAREMGIPAVVGTHEATHVIQEGQAVTVSCAEGEIGYVYEGQLPFEIKKIALDTLPEAPCDVMMNVANPERAFDLRFLPHRGIGLARLEFVISQMIGIHPNACLSFETLPLPLQESIRVRSAGYPNPRAFYIHKIIEGVATLAAAFHPYKVIVRFSDFKSNEYANLLGGELFEPKEENPMIGFRGASRYLSEKFAPCFALECEAIRYVREEMGFRNVQVMVPFVRTVEEGKQVLLAMRSHGLVQGQKELSVIMMCELPSNAILAEDFLAHFDGFSIGSNDLTQLTLGLDRDSGLVAGQFDERNKAVQVLMQKAIAACRKENKYIGICGQGPSDHPELAQWLVEQGIESVSLNPDTVLETWLLLANKKIPTG